MGRIADLRVRAQRHTRNVYDELFTRRVSIYITAVLYPLGVSANAVSGFSCLVAVAACTLIGVGHGWQVLLGVAGVHLFAVLDSVDGELARLHQRFTIKGLFLEDLCAFTMINGMFLALGGYLVRTTGAVWPLALCVLTVAFGRNAMQVARRAVLASVAGKRRIEGTLRPAAPRSGLRYVVENILLHFTNMWIITTSLVLVEELGGLHHLHLVEIALCFFCGIVLLKELAVVATFLVSDSLEQQVLEVYEQAKE